MLAVPIALRKLPAPASLVLVTVRLICACTLQIAAHKNKQHKMKQTFTNFTKASIKNLLLCCLFACKSKIGLQKKLLSFWRYFEVELPFFEVESVFRRNNNFFAHKI